MLLLPKEHGAYGQVAFPILTTLAVCGASVPATAVAAAACAGFLAHEPALVLLGQRGVRAARAHGGGAATWLAVWAAVMLGAAAVALATTPATVRWSLLVPAVPACVLALLAWRGREKSSSGEVAGALAFSGVSVPMAMTTGGSLLTGLTIAIPFALLFVAGTLAVRVVILRVRAGGDVRAAAAARRAAFGVAGGAAAALLWASARSTLPVGVLIAAAPGLITAMATAAHPPAPTRLRTLGWTLVAASVVTAGITIAAAAR